MPCGDAAEGGDPLGRGVDHGPDRLDLRVDHLVHGDEVGAHDVPVHVLEGQRQVVEGVQAVLQQPDDLGGVLLLQAGDGERRDGGVRGRSHVVRLPRAPGHKPGPSAGQHLPEQVAVARSPGAAPRPSPAAPAAPLARRPPRPPPRSAVPRRTGRPCRAGSTARWSSWRRCSGSSRAAPCPGAATWSSSTPRGRAGSRVSSWAISWARSRIAVGVLVARQPRRTAACPCCPLVTGAQVRPSSARRSRTTSATGQHSCSPAGLPGSRSMTSRSGVQRPAVGVHPPLRHVQLERGEVGQVGQRRRGRRPAGR